MCLPRSILTILYLTNGTSLFVQLYDVEDIDDIDFARESLFSVNVISILLKYLNMQNITTVPDLVALMTLTV